MILCHSLHSFLQDGRNEYNEFWDCPMNKPEPAGSLFSAPQIDGIEIIELLGKGGMAFVYKARQKLLDRIVAVKVLSKMAICGEGGIKRFYKEAKLTSMLEHPNIVRVFSFGLSKDEQPYFVLEYLQGLSLADELKQNGCLTMRKFKEIFLPVLSALEHAHQAGLVHRDLKPGNIMICHTDSGLETVKLVDFGIAKVFSGGTSETQQFTKSGAVVGSPSYMSPEQCKGNLLDGRSDLYSIACVMYESLSGEPPFVADSSLDIMRKHIEASPPSLSDFEEKSDIAADLGKVVLSGLAKDPALRPQSASDFAKRLNTVMEQITLDRLPMLKKPVARSVSPRLQRFRVGLIVLLCFLGSAGVILYCKKQAQQKRDASEIEFFGKQSGEERGCVLSKFKQFSSSRLRRNVTLQVEKMNDLKLPESERLQFAETVAQAPGNRHLEDRLKALCMLFQSYILKDETEKAIQSIDQMSREVDKLVDCNQKNLWLGRLSRYRFMLNDKLGNHAEARIQTDASVAFLQKCSGIIYAADDEIATILSQQINSDMSRNEWADAAALSKKMHMFVANNKLSGSDTLWVIQADMLMARCLVYDNKNKEALQYILESNKLARSNEIRLMEQLDHLEKLSYQCIWSKNLCLAEKIQVMAESLLNSCPEPLKTREAIRFALTKVNILQSQGKKDQEHVYLMQCEKLLETQDDALRSDPAAAQQSSFVGNGLRQLGDNENAEKVLVLSRKLFFQFPNTLLRLQSTTSLAEVCYEKHDYARAETLLQEGIKLEEGRKKPDTTLIEKAKSVLKKINLAKNENKFAS